LSSVLAASIFVLGLLFDAPAAAVVTLLVAASIPVLIHVFNRSRYRVIPWAAMHFLDAAQHENVRRMRLEQIILLLIRTLIVLLLISAMASVMPWAEELIWQRVFPSASAASPLAGHRTHKIIVLDGSFSMGAKTQETSCFERARAGAARILERSPAGDGFSVILMAAPPRRIVGQPSDDAHKVAQEIEALRLPHGNADLVATLNTVEEVLRQSPDKFHSREVYVVTDMGRSTWITRQGADAQTVLHKIQARARFVMVDTGEDGIANVAVSRIALGDSLATVGTVTPISADIHNYGPETRKQMRVELLVGKGRAVASDAEFAMRPVQEQLIDIAPGQTLTITFAHKFSVAGEYVVQVRLERDALELDDVRSIVVTVKDTIPVMLVNGKPAVEVYDTATEWLKDALNPFPSEQAPRYVAARPKVLSEFQFADAALGDLGAVDCVFLCDMPGLTPVQVRRLENHLQRGGGVVFFLGPQVDLDAYNRFLHRDGEGLLPARLMGRQRAPHDSYLYLLADEDAYRQPPLAAFAADSDRLSLARSRFRQYVRAVIAPRSRAQKILSFVPALGPSPGQKTSLESASAAPSVNDPALITASRRRGRVVLFTSTANMDWNSWPASPSFPAFVQELLRYAVVGRLREQEIEVGEPLEEFFPPGTASLSALVHTPDGRTEATQIQDRDEGGVLRWMDTERSGVYRATVGRDPRDYLFAVNVPRATSSHESSESDLARTNREELLAAYPGWEFELVADLSRLAESSLTSAVYHGKRTSEGFGTAVARYLLLGMLLLLVVEIVVAWIFGRSGATGAGLRTRLLAGRRLPVLLATGVWIVLLAVVAILLHAAWTGEFLGMLPESARRAVEARLQVPPPVPGEGTRWRLDFLPYIGGMETFSWLAPLILLVAGTLVVTVYLRERSSFGGTARIALSAMRIGSISLTMLVLLPQLRLLFERQSLPDVAVLIDDSRSMSISDNYQDADIREVAERLAAVNFLKIADRLQLAKGILTGKESHLLETLIGSNQVKVHVYHCSDRVAQIAEVVDVASSSEVRAAIDHIHELRPQGESSHLGTAIRQVLTDFRGGSLAAIIMFTDGINTDGEDLVQAARYAAQMGIPLFFVGLGDVSDARELKLHDVQVEDSVYIDDRIVFDARLTGTGFGRMSVPVTLREKGKDAVLATQSVTVDPHGRPVRFRLAHRPNTPGDKTYVLEVPVQAAQTNSPEQNRVERSVLVREAKAIKVLYVEGEARYEYRFIKSLLERENAAEPHTKRVDLKVLLLDADNDYARIDKSALAEFPTKAELNQFDVLVIGDVDPAAAKVADRWNDVADFVREQGGGLLMIAGDRHNPRAFKDTPLRAVLPVDITGREPQEGERVSGFHLEPVAGGRFHPIFRFSPDDAENTAIWSRLQPLLWYARGFRIKPGAEVLAVHSEARADSGGDSAEAAGRYPLVVQQFVGAGRTLFYGFDESWRWRFRDDESRFNQFWIQTVRYLARRKSTRVELNVDRQAPYRRGDPILVTVRFPEDAPIPEPTAEVKVHVQRRLMMPDGPPEIEDQTLSLSKVEGSRGTYQGILTRTPEGHYRFELAPGDVGGERPHAECRVLRPPGEMDRLQMNRVDMERAAEITQGRFYTLAGAAALLDDLPPGKRVVLNATGPPHLLWNHASVLLFALFILGAEWFLRKRMHLL
jgi:hypothetical protein